MARTTTRGGGGGRGGGCQLVMQSNVCPHGHEHLYSRNVPHDFILHVQDVIDYSDPRLSVAVAEITVTTVNFPEQVRELLVYSNIAEYPRPFTGSCTFVGSYPGPTTSEHCVMMRSVLVKRGRTQTFTFDADKLWFFPFARHLNYSEGHRDTCIKVLLKELEPSPPSRLVDADYCVGVTRVVFTVRMDGEDTVVLKEDYRRCSPFHGRGYVFEPPLPPPSTH